MIVLSALVFLSPILSRHYLFDDKDLVANSPAIQDMGDLSSLFATSVFGEEAKGPLYRPLFMAIISIERTIVGKDPFWGHLASLLAHILCCLLIYYFLSNIFRNSLIPIFASLVFAVHPAHIDSVAFITNRSDILALIFVLLGAILLARRAGLFEVNGAQTVPAPDRHDHVIMMSASTLVFLAMLCKETALAFVLIIPLAFICLYLHSRRRWAITYSAYLLAYLSILGMFYLILRYSALGALATKGELTVFPTRDPQVIFPTISRVFAEYIRILFLPLDLRVDYSNYAVSRTLFEARAVLSYFVHLLLLIPAVIFIKRKPTFSLLILSFYISLLPVSHILPFLELKAERFLYIPSLFFAVAVALPLYAGSLASVKQKWYAGFIVILVIFWGSIAFNYSTNFRNELGLWKSMVERDPGNLKSRINLSDVQFRQGDFKGVEENLRYVMERKRDRIGIYSPLAVSLYLNGKLEESKLVFLAGLKKSPRDLLLNKNYAAFCYFMKDYRTAYEYVLKAEAIAPEDPDIIRMLPEIVKKYKQSGGGGKGR